jgi:hypothetical protein
MPQGVEMKIGDHVVASPDTIDRNAAGITYQLPVE